MMLDRQAAIGNAEAMFRTLQARMDDMQRQIGSGQGTETAVLKALSDLDFSYTVQQALLQGARTSNPARHEILARAVVERLLAAPDSIQGVASAAAVEALGRLSATHLKLLGLGAMVYYVGPRVRAPLMPEGVPGADSPHYKTRFKAEQGFMMPAVEAYVEWLVGCLLAYAGPAHSDLPVAASIRLCPPRLCRLHHLRSRVEAISDGGSHPGISTRRDQLWRQLQLSMGDGGNQVTSRD